ncbi:hypothetical protein BRM22_23560 [Xanthomonas oryzae pv. oryzae]|nr:hypothetical protein BRN26_22855 [Xanthomonas oryzae pv. oryzae]RBC21718.1 hypothetical protein BRN28_23855 [Xanthomonas oryzae pv. oryzae]RBC92675.1 hypothetical protein BRN02_21895 [Xanthomonas oryzae pv. oryzae]RBD10529.1 hypothetical protein BRM27_13695 [Xanthomonas oryzae pv. oryzae]RBD30074.1 hypothetical protein BRM21_09420 [Xanthomonas oryzae pv. oryzae]
MPPHSEQIVSRICGALFRGSLAVELDERRRRSGTVVGRTGNWNGVMRAVPARMPALPPTALSGMRGMKIPNYLD